jgi:transcriptional regulator with XRE-family HTH domain
MDTLALPFYGKTLQAPLPKHGYPQQLNSLGDHIRARRIDLALLQKDVARLIGASVATIGNWEMGHSLLAVHHFPALISFLGYNPLPEAKTPGEVIHRARMALGLSLAELSKLTGVDPATIRRLECDTPGTARRCRAAVNQALGLWSEHSI